MFENRKEAGQKLGKALERYKNCEGLILAIPRGGAEVGFYVAEHLKLPLEIVVVRKLPMPDNPEAGFGAIAEDGSTFFIPRFKEWIPAGVVRETLAKQKEEVKRRIDVLRKGRILPEIKDKIVILVDDGIAMGSTVQAAVMLCRNKKAKKVIVASPVAGPQVAEELAKVADEVVILEKPPYFRAVAQSYENWYDVPDEEVLGFLEKGQNFLMRTRQ